MYMEKEEQENTKPSKPTIKHLVIGGGGTYGFQAFGILVELREKGFWKTEDLVSCHGTSIGVILIIMMLLPYSNTELSDYFIHRPWHQLFKYNINQIFNAFQNSGIYDIQIFRQTLSPLLKGADLEENITLKEFYEYTKIDLHINCTDVNNYQAVDISHRTHPDWTLVEAVYSSCCLPILFKPLEKDGLFYIDGGFFMNYPLIGCMETMDKGEVLGIYKECQLSKPMDKETTLLEYLNILLQNTGKYIDKQCVNQIDYEIEIVSPQITINEFFKFAESDHFRKEWVDLGRKIALEKLTQWEISIE